MVEYRAVAAVLVVSHLLEREVTARAPPGPLSPHRVVVTTQGSVRGYFAPHPPHYSYLGLPYARPPTRYDRFKAPEPPPQWSGIFEAIHRIKCPQPDGSGDENCLVVNVFTPEHAETAPVIVHIHDGGFQSGVLTNTSRIFRPCIERVVSEYHNLLDRDPRDVLREGKYQHVPLMIVYTQAEEVDIILNDHETFQSIVDNIEDLLPANLIFDSSDVKYKIIKLIKKFYFDDIDTAGSITHSLTDYINDVFMEYPIAKSVTYYANRNTYPVYLMKFGDHHTRLQNDRNAGTNKYNKICRYITSDKSEDSEDLQAKKLVMLWTNFINFGDPTPLTSPLLPVIWQPVQVNEIHGQIAVQKIPCLQFDESFTNILLSGKHLKFWDSIYDKFYKTNIEKLN
ncbi:unnamed protein product [Danaus chrysippus]|uniref:(African queen) hypothetical protein n=1 Tax=Danaus chrysippus TaxID=151541 RepID=A0A8J2QMB6_9NEOP|nr:unnamed protein product [Danaus chrysippus]